MAKPTIYVGLVKFIVRYVNFPLKLYFLDIALCQKEHTHTHTLDIGDQNMMFCLCIQAHPSYAI
jgi:hypothetical protein